MENVVIIGGTGAKELMEQLGMKHPYASATSAEDFNGLEYYCFNHEGTGVFLVMCHGYKSQRDPARLEPKFLAEQLEKIAPPEKTLIVQTSASGSLDTTIKLVDEGGIVVCSDVMRGFGYRGSSRSLSNRDGPVHAVMNGAFSEKARKLALEAIAQVERATAYDGGIYINNQGNQFETKAEVAFLCAQLDLLETVRCLGEIVSVFSSVNSHDLSPKQVKMFDRFNGNLAEHIHLYRHLSSNLYLKNAQVSMNAARELEPLVETGYKDIVLLAFPVNYGVGLIPDEKVDHERTKQAIKNGLPYIVPTLKNIVKMASKL